MPVAEEKLSNKTLCNVVLSFKSLLLFIYGLMHAILHKLTDSGTSETPNQKKEPKVINSRQSKNSTKLRHDGNGNITRYWRAPAKQICDMPGPKSMPFFGTLLTSSALRSSDLMKSNEDRERRYGPMVKEEHFWNHPIVMILGSEEIKKIIKLNPITRPGMEILVNYRTLRSDRYDSVGLVNSEGDVWKHLHYTFTPVTTNMTFVRSLLNVVNDICDDAVNCLAKEPQPTQEFPNVLNKLITEASFYTALGRRMGFIGNQVGPSENMNIFWNCHDMYWRAFHQSMYGFPWWKYFPTKVWNEFTAAEDKMMDILAELIDNLLAEGAEGGILDAVQKDELSKRDLKCVLLELVIGATEPVFQTTMLTLHWICTHEHVYNKVLAELRVVMPNKDSPVNEDVLDNVPYVKACLQETFRICPSACNLARHLEKDMHIGGYFLPRHTIVVAQTWHACLKDENFYRAKEFLPERWLLPNGVPPFKPHERQIMCNFGMGTRTCLGRKIAQQLIYTFLCKILRRFKIKFTDKMDIRYEWLLVVKPPITIELQENDA